LYLRGNIDILVIMIDETGDTVNRRKLAPFNWKRPLGVNCSVESTRNAAEDSIMERFTLVLSLTSTTLTVLEH